MNEKFEAVNDPGLNAIKEKKALEDLSLFRQNPTKNNEEDNCNMASKMGNPRHHFI